MYFVVIYAFLNFILQKFCLCKKNDKYKVCVIWETRMLLKEPHCIMYTVYTLQGLLIFTPQGGAENGKDSGFLD